MFTLMCHDQADDANAAAPPERSLRRFRVGSNRPYLVLHEEPVSEPPSAPSDSASFGEAGELEASGRTATEVSDTAT